MFFMRVLSSPGRVQVLETESRSCGQGCLGRSGTPGAFFGGGFLASTIALSNLKAWLF